MKLISIGDLVLDYYYKNDKLLGVNGGMSSHNIIANLANFGISTAVFGVCGNDLAGKLTIKSLEDLKIDVSNIKILNDIKTRCFHVSYIKNDDKLSIISKKRCPKCNEKQWYEESLIDCDFILNNINDEDILVFDNLNIKNQTIIDNTKNKKIIDLGQYFEFENLTKNEIIKKMKNKFEIINFNERVTKYLIKKLKLNNELELYNCIKPKLMTVTKAENGALFIYNNKIYSYKLLSKGNVIDSTGAGDAFISSIIRDWIKNNYQYSSNLFDLWYKNSNKLTSKVVSKIGARGHINSLYKIKKINNNCTCNEFTYMIRKQIKRCNININNLEKRIKNAVNSSVSLKIRKINFNENDNCLFVGTGGSFACAHFASRVINELYGCNTYTLYPRDIIYRNNKKINKIILFSYSGTTNDIITSVKNFDKKNIFIITKGEISNITTKTEINKSNILSYRTLSNKGKDRGFLSFEGVVAPAAIFLKYYFDNNKIEIDINNFIEKSINYWKNYLDKIFIKKSILIKDKGLINIFSGDYTNSACYDLESKITESGIFNCIIHEKKNFSHGRFINYENLNNIYSIYFKQKTTSDYEEELLKYLGEETILIESNYDGILAEFDLLIASQYIIYYIGKALDIDVSKPSYSKSSMNIYFYKGSL